ncbi:MAG: IS21 family transposase [Nitrospirae bacterium]|nr:MAG: IS21 family transposase [Nitrospirota bacterium]
MSGRRLHMRKLKQILRLSLKEKLSHRTISKSLRISRRTVSEYLQRAKAAGIKNWEEVKEVPEVELEKVLFPIKSRKRRREISCQYIHNQLNKTKGTTLLLLWQEYYQQDPTTAYSYSQFCLLYQQWQKRLPIELRNQYRGGETMFVDYSGEGIPYIEKGEKQKAEIFVATLGASDLIYCEAQESQKLSYWIKGHINAFKYIGGVPEKVIPDNLKAAVKKPCYYEPELNPVYDDLSLHYDFVIIPTRVRKPKDKGKVENAVQQIQRWVIAPLRNSQFFSVLQINEAIRELLKELNNKKMKHIGKSRMELFNEIERGALKPLPIEEFELSERRHQKVGANYHVSYERHYYSVPYTLIGQSIEIRATDRTIEVYHRGQRVAVHLRDDTPGGYTTVDEHMPQSHKRVKITPEGLLRWASRIGPSSVEVVERVLNSKRHIEQAYKVCTGILKLEESYGKEALEKACSTAIDYEIVSYRHIKNILKTGMSLSEDSMKTTEHENLRGSGYYN